MGREGNEARRVFYWTEFFWKIPDPHCPARMLVLLHSYAHVRFRWVSRVDNNVAKAVEYSKKKILYLNTKEKLPKGNT